MTRLVAGRIRPNPGQVILLWLAASGVGASYPRCLPDVGGHDWRGASSGLAAGSGWPAVYTRGVSADRSDLVRLAEQIPDDEVPGAIADLRRRLRPVGERSWPPSWFSIAEGDGTAVGARSEEILAEGFGR